jgi:antitoxin (DNA-binding transcriptional repressor) of toxin-antitoxin stability system
MYHMARASVRDLRYAFKKVERLLQQGEEVEITKRRQVIARLVPAKDAETVEVPDFMARLRAIYGGKLLRPTGAELLADDRNRY